MSATAMVDQAKLESFVGNTVGEFGSVVSSALVLIGDKLGLYRAMAGSGGLTPSELAVRTGTSETYIYPWLVNQAASGYLEFDATTGRYTLPPEQAVAFTDETSPFFVLGGFQVITSAIKAQERIADLFVSGKGMAWGDHDSGLFHGTERFFRPGYEANLVNSWIPSLDGAEAKLRSGATVADVGCGHGASTIIMARAYSNSRFFGYDYHAPSIQRAREAAAEAGVADRIVFQVCDAAGIPGSDYDIVAFFDALHDIGNPSDAARQARNVLKPDGHLFIVEPMAGESTQENINPVGRIFSAASVLICTPNALAAGDDVHALGTIATEKAIRDVVLASGFSSFRRAAETPFNRVFEARP